MHAIVDVSHQSVEQSLVRPHSVLVSTSGVDTVGHTKWNRSTPAQNHLLLRLLRDLGVRHHHHEGEVQHDRDGLGAQWTSDVGNVRCNGTYRVDTG